LTLLPTTVVLMHSRAACASYAVLKNLVFEGVAVRNV